MRTLYLDCSMGAAGDMLTAALLELLPDPAGFVEKLNRLGIPGVEYRAEPSVKCGITGTHMTVTVHGQEEEQGSEIRDQGSGEMIHSHTHTHEHEHGHTHEHSHEHEHGHTHEHSHEHDHHHHHSDLHGIEHLVRDHMALPEAVREDVLAVYRLIADAESRVHGVPVEEIHFHEVGTMDALADVSAVCLLMRELAPERVLASPVHVGSGQVRCAHGIMPVPAPATAELLKDIPIYGGSMQGELCTPTGAALLRYFVHSFGPMPPLRVRALGYGMGRKDFPAANCVRALLGETEDRPEEVLELACNLDDMSPEALGFAMERLLEAGALDVWTQAIGMKKSRPGVLLSVLCKPEQQDTMLRLLLRHTSSLGVRFCRKERSVLARQSESLETAFGPVGVKRASGFGVEREKYEYEDLARIAQEQDLSLEEARTLVRQAAERQGSPLQQL